MNPSFAIDADHISFSYPDGFLALQDIVFRVRTGEFVAMLASNGSGKTTLIKLLVGLLKPSKGVIRINDCELKKLSPSALYQTVGMVFQNPIDQLFAATVSEDVAFGPRNLALAEDEIQQRVDKALASVGAEALRDRAIQHLSFGEQKRVTIAGVLAMKPRILILDEPTAGLDPAGEHSMMRLLGELNRTHGITIVLATHSVDTLPLFADRIYLLNRGRVIREGSVTTVFRDQELLHRAGLRLPYVSSLLDELNRLDGVSISELPLTLGEARRQLLELISDEFISTTPGRGKSR